MIIPKLVIVSLKRKGEATPVLPVILESPSPPGRSISSTSVDHFF